MSEEKQNRYNTKQNMVTFEPERPTVRRMTPEESAALASIAPAQAQPSTIQMPALPQATHSGHLRDNFDIRATAKVAERFIIWDMGIFGAVTASIAGLIWYQVGGDVTVYSLGWLVAWGAVSYYAMNRNRAQAYDHSPTGVARLEQHSQLAMHDRSSSVQEYQIDADKEVRLAEVQLRRELGQQLVNRLGGNDER